MLKFWWKKHSPKIELSAREATAFKRLILWSATVNFPSEPFKTAKMDLSRVKIASESEHFKAREATHFTADSRVESSLACSCVAKGLARSPTYPLKSIDKETKIRLKKKEKKCLFTFLFSDDNNSNRNRQLLMSFILLDFSSIEFWNLEKKFQTGCMIKPLKQFSF